MTMLDRVPAVTIAPPLRCYQRLENSRRQICGAPARWERPGRDWFVVEYFCDSHRSAGDVLASSEHVFRRVRVLVEVFLSGCSTNAPLAQTEAVAQLTAAVAAAGGRLEVHAVHSNVVKSLPQTGQDRDNGSGGVAE